MGADRMPPRCGEEGARSITPLRCAIYTRKSTEEGLNQEFNSLEAQREAAEAYIASQRQLGWILVPERYDDAGYTGGNLERPALQKLLRDIEQSKVDCVLVYKVDRLSRSLLDFARLMEIFERHQVSLVSVTQPLNTTTSLGRLTLNILLSFAQFEREMIADRTRDKMAAARRKGKWVGGKPVLGYDVAATGGKLVVNPEEASRVQAIFALYLQHRSLEAVLAELQARQWTTKRWRTRYGKEHPGRSFTKPTLMRLLRNVLYVGQVSHQGQVYAGEQAAVVEKSVWARVRELLPEGQNGSCAAAKSSREASQIRSRRRPPTAVAEAMECVPRITRLLALALRFEEMIRSGVVGNYTVMAELGQVSRSRVTQVTNLLNLAPDIQEEILFLRPEEAERLRISELSIRKLSARLEWGEQRAHWRRLREPA
ncbi:MAG TPA: recombinase family protein [Terriglobales bacterium]|nr:recombinase family protein [Terriglobales bacterium]